jgi:hypothetical protein
MALLKFCIGAPCTDLSDRLSCNLEPVSELLDLKGKAIPVIGREGL